MNNYGSNHCDIIGIWKQLVDDVEFWFPPGNDSIVEYRSASRLGNFDFDYNRKRIKVQFFLLKVGAVPFSIIFGV